MKVLVVLTVCSVFIGAYAASIPDGNDEPIYDLVGTVTELDSATEINDDRDEAFELESIDEEEPDTTGFRARRFSCDVLSFQSKWLSPNHSACAVRCLAQRRRGGKCDKGVCVCRGKKWGK